MAISYEFLSASSNGKFILVSGTTTGTSVSVHTAHATSIDEVYIEFVNNHTSSVQVTLEWGAGATAEYQHVFDLPAKSNELKVAGRPLSGSETIKVFASVANVVNIAGHVNRIT